MRGYLELQDTLIAALRRGTVPHHAAIEDLLGLRDGFGLDHYARIVRGFESFLTGWEPAIARALPPGLRAWFLPRCRAHLARRDLAALSVPRLMAPQDAMLSFANLPAALGSLYVMEGSALGGQVISHHLARQHGMGPQEGAAYFNGWGSRTASMWHEFQEVLDAHDPGASGHAQAVAGAQATFDALSATFQTVIHGPVAA